MCIRDRDHTKTVLLSTASPYKFPESVYQAIYGEELDVYTAIDKLSEKTGVPVPQALAGIKEREVLHKEAIDKTAVSYTHLDVYKRQGND